MRFVLIGVLSACFRPLLCPNWGFRIGVVTPTLTVPMEFAGILVVVIDIFYPGLMQIKVRDGAG